MEKRSNVWNFYEVNTEKKFSKITKAVVVGLAIAFLIVPLSTISPETFVIPESVAPGYETFCCYKLC